MIIKMIQKALTSSELLALQKARHRVTVLPKHKTKNIIIYYYYQVRATRYEFIQTIWARLNTFHSSVY